MIATPAPAHVVAAAAAAAAAYPDIAAIQRQLRAETPVWVRSAGRRGDQEILLATGMARGAADAWAVTGARVPAGGWDADLLPVARALTAYWAHGHGTVHPSLLAEDIMALVTPGAAADGGAVDGAAGVWDEARVRSLRYLRDDAGTTVADLAVLARAVDPGIDADACRAAALGIVRESPESGVRWPSARQEMERMGFVRAVVHAVFRDLREEGLIRVERTPDGEPLLFPAAPAPAEAAAPSRTIPGEGRATGEGPAAPAVAAAADPLRRKLDERLRAGDPVCAPLPPGLMAAARRAFPGPDVWRVSPHADADGAPADALCVPTALLTTLRARATHRLGTSDGAAVADSCARSLGMVCDALAVFGGDVIDPETDAPFDPRLTAPLPPPPPLLPAREDPPGGGAPAPPAPERPTRLARGPAAPPADEMAAAFGQGRRGAAAAPITDGLFGGQ